MAVLAALAAPPRAAAAPCPHAHSRPGQASVEKLGAAVTCLVDRARAHKGVAKLAANTDLDQLAQHHAARMVSQSCFTHRCPGEARLKRRLRRSPYVKGASSFRYAEELGYESTPAEMVNRWIASAPHRRNILGAGYRDLGVGVRRGAPVKGVNDSKFVTYTLELAVRKK